MIRYADALEGIEAAIGQAWLDKAHRRTAIFRGLRQYVEEHIDSDGTTKKLPPFWSDVKETYVKRQHGKCVYCETLLEFGENAGVQWDLEHFRPKGNVRIWPPVKSKLRAKYAHIPMGKASAGYHLLAYSPFNYAASCKTCNTIYKSDYFPIAAGRVQGRTNPGDYLAEQPYLIYPLGSVEDDPSDIITFDGATAKPKSDVTQNAVKWWRGSVIIDFFGLNRDGLQRNRAHWLYHAVWPRIKLADNGDHEAIENLKLAKTEFSPHANCASCFIDLCASNRAAAIRQVDVFKQILRLAQGDSRFSTNVRL